MYTFLKGVVLITLFSFSQIYADPLTNPGDHSTDSLGSSLKSSVQSVSIDTSKDQYLKPQQLQKDSTIITANTNNGCTKDTDCKGDRVCENGVCVSIGKTPESAIVHEQSTNSVIVNISEKKQEKGLSLVKISREGKEFKMGFVANIPCKVSLDRMNVYLVYDGKMSSKPFLLPDKNEIYMVFSRGPKGARIGCKILKWSTILGSLTLITTGAVGMIPTEHVDADGYVRSEKGKMSNSTGLGLLFGGLGGGVALMVPTVILYKHARPKIIDAEKQLNNSDQLLCP